MWLNANRNPNLTHPKGGGRYKIKCNRAQTCLRGYKSAILALLFLYGGSYLVVVHSILDCHPSIIHQTCCLSYYNSLFFEWKYICFRQISLFKAILASLFDDILMTFCLNSSHLLLILQCLLVCFSQNFLRQL